MEVDSQRSSTYEILYDLKVGILSVEVHSVLPRRAIDLGHILQVQFESITFQAFSTSSLTLLILRCSPFLFGGRFSAQYKWLD
jgi:hypothetical protein